MSQLDGESNAKGSASSERSKVIVFKNPQNKNQLNLAAFGLSAAKRTAVLLIFNLAFSSSASRRKRPDHEVY